MEKYCQNPLCEAEAVKEVKVSVRKPSDEKRALCACCEEVFVWGMQHGKKLSRRQKAWILAIADRGIIAYGEAYPTKKQAEQGLIDYLRKEENYDGSDEISEAANWLAENDERLSAEIFKAESCFDSEDNDVTEEALNGAKQLQRFLDDKGFIVIGQNQHDPHPDQPFEAWAYHGPLDFQSAVPVTFGQGQTPMEALCALDEQLDETHPKEKTIQPPVSHLIASPPPESGTEPLWRIIYTIDVNAPDAGKAALAIHEIMKDPESWDPVLEVMDSQGHVTRIDLSETDNDRGKEADHV
jgi:hypothetical protein